MGKDDPCSSKTKLNSSTNMNKDKTIPPLRIKRSNIERHSPSPRPRFKCRDPPPVNPIADQVSEKDFQDLQKYKDISSDPDTIKSFLQNGLSREKLLPRTQRGSRRFTTQHMPDKMDNLSHPNATEDANENNDEIMQNDCVDDENIVEEVPTEMPSLSTKEVDENILKDKIKIASSSVLSSASTKTDSPMAKKRRIEMVDSSQLETLETSVTSSPLIEVQNNLDRDSLSRNSQRSQSIGSGSETSNDQENSTMNPNSSTPRSKRRKRKTWGKKRGKKVKVKVDPTDDTEPEPKKKKKPYWFLVSILVRRMVTKSTAKKWTFLSAHDRSKLSANPKTGLLYHPFRIPDRPEPFTKESASYCVKYADTVAEYTPEEKKYWSKQDMGPEPYDYERKIIDGKPRKPIPTKEYFQRILGGRPRSYSMTTYSEYQHIYSEKNRLDKPARKEKLFINNNTFFGRRSKSAERVARSRTRLITTYNMRKFNVPNLNLESQVMFSFLRKYDKGKFYQTFSVFWAEYHKEIEKECILEGKEFVPPTIYSVIPYEYVRLSDSDEAKIAPDSSKMNFKPWVIDCAEKLLEFFKYDVKPLFPVIQPMHEELINHPTIISAAKSKLRQLTYETLSLKQWFLNIYNGNKDALKLWKKKKAILYRKRFLENRYFEVGGINELLPKQYRAKTVSPITDEQSKFLYDQKKWMYDKLKELRIEEEKHRKKEEEKQRKAEIRKLAKEAAKSKIVDNSKKTPIKNNKRKQSVQKGVKAKKPKYSDGIEPNEFDPDDIEFEITAESLREFSPELTASYNSQSESFLLDQSCLSNASAHGNSTAFLGEISEANVVEFKEKEITEEISLKLPETSSASNTYICRENEAIVCDPFVTKAASKRETFVEASIKAPRQKGRKKFTVPIKKKLKVKAKFVIKTKTVDSKFKKSSEKEKYEKIIDKAKIDLSAPEPSLKNVEADIPLVTERISEEAADKLPQDIMGQHEKVPCTINLCKVPAPIHETDKLLQFEEKSDTLKEVEDMNAQQHHIGSDFENTEKESLTMADAEIFEDLPAQKSPVNLLNVNDKTTLSESLKNDCVKEVEEISVEQQHHIIRDLSELVNTGDESSIKEKEQNISESLVSVNTVKQNLFENIAKESVEDVELIEALPAQKSSDLLTGEKESTERVESDTLNEVEDVQQQHIGSGFENTEKEYLAMADAEIFEDLPAKKSSDFGDNLSDNNESVLSESVKRDAIKKVDDMTVQQQQHIGNDLPELVNTGDEYSIKEKEQNIFETFASVNTVEQTLNIDQEPLQMADAEIFKGLPAQKSSVDLLNANDKTTVSEVIEKSANLKPIVHEKFESSKNKEVEEITVEQQHHITGDLSELVNTGDESSTKNVDQEPLQMADAEIFEDLSAQKSSDFGDILSDNNESILSESVKRDAIKKVDDMTVQQQQHIGNDLPELVNTGDEYSIKNIDQEPLQMADAEIFEDLPAQKPSVDLLNANNKTTVSEVIEKSANSKPIVHEKFESAKNKEVEEITVEQQHHITGDLSELVNTGDESSIKNVEKEQNIFETFASVNTVEQTLNIEQEPLTMADAEILEDLPAQKSSVDLLNANDKTSVPESAKNDSVKEVEDHSFEQQPDITRYLSELANAGNETVFENDEKQQNIPESSISVPELNTVNQTLFIEKKPVEDVELIEALPAQKSSDLLTGEKESTERVNRNAVKEGERMPVRKNMSSELKRFFDLVRCDDDDEPTYPESVESNNEKAEDKKAEDKVAQKRRQPIFIDLTSPSDFANESSTKNAANQSLAIADTQFCEVLPVPVLIQDKVVTQREVFEVPTPTKLKSVPKLNKPRNKVVEKLAIEILEPNVEEKPDELKLPLSLKKMMEMSQKSPPVPVLTEFLSLDDLMNERKTFQTEQIMRQTYSPHFAFKIGENIVINCGKVGVHDHFSQAIISDKECKVYDYYNGNWKCRMILCSKNVLLFDRPYGTRRYSHINGNATPSNCENDYEIVVYKHDFGTFLDYRNGEMTDIYFYYTYDERKLILFYEEKDKYLFDLIWSPYLQYFVFLSVDNDVFDEIVLECYNVAFDTTYPPTKLLPKQLNQNNILSIKKQRSDSRKSYTPRRQTSSGSGGSSSNTPKHGSTSHRTTYNHRDNQRSSSQKSGSGSSSSYTSNKHASTEHDGSNGKSHRSSSKSGGSSSSNEHLSSSHGTDQKSSSETGGSLSSNEHGTAEKASSESGGSSSYTSKKHASTEHGESNGKSHRSLSKSGGSSSSNEHLSSSHGTAEKPSSESDGSSTSMHISKAHGGASSTSSTTTTTTTTKNDIRQRNDRKQNRQITFPKIIKKNCEDHNSRVFDSSDPSLVIPFDAFKSEKLKPHRRIVVKEGQAYMLKEHQRLISYYAKKLEAKIREYSKINTIYTKRITDFPSLMIKLGTTLLFSDETDNFALKPVDEKMKDKYRNFMGNIVAVSLCDAMRILTCLFSRTSLENLNKAIINFHVGERFKFAASQLFYCKPGADWRYLDNALALNIFEYSKDTSTLTFFFIRHLINAFKYTEFMEYPDNAYKNYYTNIIDFGSSFYYAERIVMDTMNKFYQYITDMVDDLPEFPPNNMLTDLIPLPKDDSQLSRSITVTGKTFNFKYEYNHNVQKLNAIIPFEMFYPQKLNIIPFEIQCKDLNGNDYFMDPIIPRWIFMINNIIIIHPTTYRILYHTCQFAETYLFPFDNIHVPFFEKFRGVNGKLNFYGLIKSGMPVKVTDICTQAYLHATREPFDKSVIKGIEETREWLKAPHLLQIDYDSGLLHSTWKTICTILRARHEHGLLSKDDTKFQSISTDLMRRFRLHEFELDTNLKIYIPNPPIIPSPAYIPVAVLPYKK